MALVGGGGAPNVAGGSNPSGTGSGLNYVGDHAYAMSGQVSADDNETTLLEFSTQGNYIVANVQFNSMNELAQECEYRIYINDEVIQNFLAGNNAPDYRGKPNNSIEILIPSFSTVKMTAQNNDDSTSLTNQVVTILGRVYA